MKHRSVILLVARVLLALIFVAGGANKAMHAAETVAYMESMGVPGGLLPLVAAFEVLVGFALIAGYRASLACILLALFTLAAGAIFHHAFNDVTQLTMFMKNLAIAGGMIALAAAGPGELSMDARSPGSKG